MFPKTHIILGIIFSLILIYFFNFSLLAGIIVFLSSVLIDVDHYLYYVYKKKDLNLKKAYNYFIGKIKKLKKLPEREKRKTYTSFCFLHGFEIMFILSLLGFFFSFYFYYIILGFLFHLIFDYIDQIKNHKRFDRISLIYDFIKFRKLRYLE